MRILVVEDQRKLAAFLRKGLTESGYSTDLAETASTADELIASNPYDLIILDIGLPDSNGIDFAKKIRSEGYGGPIIMLTALAGTKDKVRGLDAGADDYLTKPFEFEELLARVRALLRRKESQSVESQLKFSDLTMDLVTRKVTRAQQDIQLTKKEFALLEYFLRNPNRPVTRTSLSEHVWDVHFDSESNVVDVYVAMLRKKVDHPFSKKLIHTIVGVGYVLKLED